MADHHLLVRTRRSPVSPQTHLTATENGHPDEGRQFFSSTIVMHVWRQYRYVVIAILNERPSAGFVLV
jgi:hypothetical protein